MTLTYQSGFGNHFASEAVEGALPLGKNSPQKVNHGLYAEQLSGSAFTVNRAHNLRTWLYRINPSVKRGEFVAFQGATNWLSAPYNVVATPPEALRWGRYKMPDTPTDFIDGMYTQMVNGDVANLTGAAIHIYTINRSMERFFYNSDGEMLIIPQSGRLLIATEMGILEVEPLEIAIIPRGVKFRVELSGDDSAYGYVCENYGAPFRLPDLGVIGANGLANPRDFFAPVASFKNVQGRHELLCKFEGRFFSCTTEYHPLDVVAWHGNYVPYKYDLRNFNVLGSISFDHPDPSIFTVLTSASTVSGVANIDFVIFPPRWLVALDTFRPPWYHRNIMSEYMGLITGKYDAKPDGFVPGGGSLHNRMVPHGPDAPACVAATNRELKPEFLANTMAFMLESSLSWKVTDFALSALNRQTNYLECWQDIPVLFKS